MKIRINSWWSDSYIDFIGLRWDSDTCRTSKYRERMIELTLMNFSVELTWNGKERSRL